MLASRLRPARFVVAIVCAWLASNVAEASTVKKNFVACCELVQEIGGWLEYQSDFRCEAPSISQPTPTVASVVQFMP
jgi:hypothetical protein